MRKEYDFSKAKLVVPPIDRRKDADYYPHRYKNFELVSAAGA